MPPQNTLPQNTAGGISFGISNLEPNDWETVEPDDWETVSAPPQQNPYYQSPFEFGPSPEPTPQEQAPPPPSYYESPFAVKPFQFGDQRPEPEAPDPWYHPDRLIPMALRTGGGVTGGIMGGAAGSIVPGAGTIGGVALGGGLGSYIGDAAAQGYEYLRGDRPEGYNVKSGLVEGGLGAIPLMGKAPAMTAPAKEWFRHAATAPIRGAAEGTFIGGLSPVAHSLVEKQELPSWDEVKSGMKGGAAFGAATAGAFSSVPSVRRGRAANARSASQVADNAPREWHTGRILNEVDTPNFAATAADLPPIRPKSTISVETGHEINLLTAIQRLRESAHNASTEELISHLNSIGHTIETALLEPPKTVERVIADELASRGISDVEPPAISITKRASPADRLQDEINRTRGIEPTDAPQVPINQAPKVQFVDPNTGEMRTASEAQPGDVPITPESEAPQVEPQRRATKTIGRMELGPSPAADIPVRPPDVIDTANEIGRSVPPEPTGIPEIPELPQSLKGAKPRFNIGTNFYLPQFASDLDKALYIIAQTKPSKQDAQYLKFVMDNTGLDEAAARSLGQQVRGQVRRAVDNHTAAGGGSGAVEIPIIASQTPSESGGIPSSGNVDAAAPPSTDTGGAGGIPPIIPPVITGGTGDIGGNIPPPGPPNAPGSVPQPPSGGSGRRPPPIKPPKPPILNADQIDPNIPVQRRKSPAARKSRYGMFGQAYNASRTLQSIDLPGMTSAAFRQSRPLSGTLDWFRAFASGAKAFGSDEALAIINDKVSNRKYQKPRYQPVVDRTGGVVKYVEMPSIAEELGLRLDDVHNPRADTISRSLAERIPGYGRYVKASNRTNVAFLNDLASAKFEQLMDAAIAEGRDPRVDRVLGKKLADLVNNATGRASLKYFGGRANFEPLAEEIGFALWSPRYLSAKLAFMNPHNYITQDPMVRKEYWKGLARVGIGWGAATGLASMLPGAKVSFDANNSDFGKVRFGNKRLDFGAGWLQLMVLAHREFPKVLGGGGTRSSTSGAFTPFGSDAMAETRFSLPGRYLYNQMSPSSRFIADMLRATQKQPVDLTDRMIQQALPMYATDIAEAAKGDPAVADFFAPFLSSMGAGVQEYKEGDFNKPKVTPFIEQVIGTKVPTVQVGK